MSNLYVLDKIRQLFLYVCQLLDEEILYAMLNDHVTEHNFGTGTDPYFITSMLLLERDAHLAPQTITLSIDHWHQSRYSIYSGSHLFICDKILHAGVTKKINILRINLQNIKIFH